VPELPEVSVSLPEPKKAEKKKNKKVVEPKVAPVKIVKK
jgi:hypothetical protein